MTVFVPSFCSFVSRTKEFLFSLENHPSNRKSEINIDAKYTPVFVACHATALSSDPQQKARKQNHLFPRFLHLENMKK
jgi:hypothetical protein